MNDPRIGPRPIPWGRFFALLERIQEDSATGKLNTTIKDRFFVSASTTPAMVFAQLFKLESSHMKKLHRDKPGLAVVREKELGELMGRMDAPIPPRLNLQDQCTFYLGYYHRHQEFFESKKEEAVSHA